jgi:hypothetical protein
MDISPILNADGRAVVTFGGRRSWRTRTVRGLIVSWEWCRDPDNRKRIEPCIAIWNPAASDSGAWVITRRGMMKFSDQHNKPTPHAFREARIAATEMLGLSAIDMDVRRVVDVVMDSVDELVQMPLVPLEVRQQLKRQSVWTVERRDLNRRVLSEHEA